VKNENIEEESGNIENENNEAVSKKLWKYGVSAKKNNGQWKLMAATCRSKYRRKAKKKANENSQRREKPEKSISKNDSSKSSEEAVA